MRKKVIVFLIIILFVALYYLETKRIVELSNNLNDTMVEEFHTGGHSVAIECLIELDSLKFSDARISSNLSDLYYLYHFQLTTEYDYSKPYIYSRILFHADRAYSLEPTLSTSRDLAYTYMIPLVSFHEVEFDWNAAQKHWGEVFKIEHTYGKFWALNNRSKCMFVGGRYKKSLELIEEALDMDLTITSIARVKGYATRVRYVYEEGLKDLSLGQLWELEIKREF